MSLKARHDRGATGGQGGLEGRQVDFMQAALGDVDRSVIEAAGRRAIGEKMLGVAPRRLPAAWRSSPWKPRTLASAKRDANQGSSPGPSAIRPQRGSRVTSSIGAKVNAIPSSAASAAATRAVRSQSSGIECGGLGERNRENGPVPMDDVEAKQQGNAEAGFLHRHSLNRPHRLGAPEIEHAADPPRANARFGVARQHRPGHDAVGRRHGELADFFLKRHRRQQRVEAVHRLPLILFPMREAHYHRGVYPPTLMR